MDADVAIHDGFQGGEGGRERNRPSNGTARSVPALELHLAFITEHGSKAE